MSSSLRSLPTVISIADCSDGIGLIEPSDGTQEVLRYAWELLSEPIWPVDEIRPFDDFCQRSLNAEAFKSSQLVFVFIVHHNVIGMAVAHFLPSSRSGFLEYLMAGPGSPWGTGAALYAEVVAELTRQGAVRVVTEYDAEDGLDAEGWKRWCWYQGRDVYRIGWPYWQPSYRPGGPAKRMTLAYDVTVCERLSSPGEMELCVSEIYECIYGLACNDPLLEAVRLGIRKHKGAWLLDIWGAPYRHCGSVSHTDIGD